MSSSISASPWRLSHKFDPSALGLADRHYNRRKIGSPQFVPPGRSLVLLTTGNDALWVTSWPFPEYVRHDWPGAWVNSLFRKEGDGLASNMIREAVAHTRWRFGDPPAEGMITFIAAAKVRHKRDPGRCYVKAGFKRVGFTKGGLVALLLAPEDMPDALEPVGAQQEMVA